MTALITIPYPTPSNNELMRMHYHRRRRLRSELVAIASAGRRAAGILRALSGERRRVTITRFGVRTLDRDNLYGGAKLLVDALCDAGAIWDDDDEHLDLVVTQQLTEKRSARTDVRITIGEGE